MLDLQKQFEIVINILYQYKPTLFATCFTKKMALLLVFGTAYVAYKSQEGADPNKCYEVDPGIELEGKTAVELLPLEQTLSLLEAPICTISFFEGQQNPSDYLRERVAAIVRLNPWLGGRILPDGKQQSIKLYFDETLSSNSDDDVLALAPGIFHCFEEGEIVLDGVEMSDYDRIISSAKVKSNKDLVGKNEPLFKVAVIPTAPQKFAVVVSMSHVGGDAHTFYRIYNMLSPKNPIVALNPVRKLLVSEAIVERMGRQETFYIKNAVATPFFQRSSASNNNNDDPLQTRQVFISSKWLKKRLEREVAHKEGDTTTSSTVEIIRVSPVAVVSSWFFDMTNCTVGLVVDNIRNKLPNFDVTDLDAGNYQTPIPLLRQDYASPELVEMALKGGKRCGSDPPAPLPKFAILGNSTYSIAVDWTQYYPHQLDLDLTKETLHLPLYNVKKLNEQTSKLSLICMHTAQAGQDSGNSRMGALIVAPQSVMEAIEASDFVDGLIL